jgi:hypothetical protein
MIATDNIPAPQLTPTAVRALIDQGWDQIIGWLANNAPPQVYRLAQSVNYLEYYRAELLQNGGALPAGLPEPATFFVVCALNALADPVRAP